VNIEYANIDYTVESTLINKNELEHSKLRDKESSKDIKVVTAPAQISAVPPWSLAAEIGLEPGDKIIAINGNKLRDIMDFEFQFRQNDELEILIKKPDESEIIIELEKDPDDVLGVEFHTPLFNGVQECANKCPFCFIENQPYEQTRESLHLRDDDFRLSYLHGSYVTLTNLSFSDRKRIEELRPGPLYVSVHATDPEVRNKMLGRKKSPAIIDELKWLDSLGIPVHTQVVLCPEMNDGQHLLQTIKELYALKNSPVLSLAVVPVGLTKFHRGGLRRFSTDEAFVVVDMVQKWEAENPKHANFVFLSDEWFLMTHSPIPEQNYYGEYPQLEDGVGMTRLFLNEVEAELRSLEIGNREKGIGKKVSWINGSMSKPIVDQVSSKINQALTGIELKPICLDSLFWGTTNVSGLLTGNDIYSALRYVPKAMLGDLIIIPSVMLKDGTEIFLDDMSLQELETKLGLPCKKAWGARELIEVVTS
jgi:putative radical SAM enzyme (TIGR03279 family)